MFYYPDSSFVSNNPGSVLDSSTGGGMYPHHPANFNSPISPPLLNGRNLMMNNSATNFNGYIYPPNFHSNSYQSSMIGTPLSNHPQDMGSIKSTSSKKGAKNFIYEFFKKSSKVNAQQGGASNVTSSSKSAKKQIRKSSIKEQELNTDSTRLKYIDVISSDYDYNVNVGYPSTCLGQLNSSATSSTFINPLCPQNYHNTVHFPANPSTPLPFLTHVQYIEDVDLNGFGGNRSSCHECVLEYIDYCANYECTKSHKAATIRSKSKSAERTLDEGLCDKKNTFKTSDRARSKSSVKPSRLELEKKGDKLPSSVDQPAARKSRSSTVCLAKPLNTESDNNANEQKVDFKKNGNISIKFDSSNSTTKISIKEKKKKNTAKKNTASPTSETQETIKSSENAKEEVHVGAKQPPPAPPFDKSLFTCPDNSTLFSKSSLRRSNIVRLPDEEISKTFDVVLDELKEKLAKIKGCAADYINNFDTVLHKPNIPTTSSASKEDPSSSKTLIKIKSSLKPTKRNQADSFSSSTSSSRSSSSSSTCNDSNCSDSFCNMRKSVEMNKTERQASNETKEKENTKAEKLNAENEVPQRESTMRKSFVNELDSRYNIIESRAWIDSSNTSSSSLDQFNQSNRKILKQTEAKKSKQDQFKLELLNDYEDDVTDDGGAGLEDFKPTNQTITTNILPSSSLSSHRLNKYNTVRSIKMRSFSVVSPMASNIGESNLSSNGSSNQTTATSSSMSSSQTFSSKVAEFSTQNLFKTIKGESGLAKKKSHTMSRACLLIETEEKEKRLFDFFNDDHQVTESPKKSGIIRNEFKATRRARGRTVGADCSEINLRCKSEANLLFMREEDSIASIENTKPDIMKSTQFVHSKEASAFCDVATLRKSALKNKSTTTIMNESKEACQYLSSEDLLNMADYYGIKVDLNEDHEENEPCSEAAAPEELLNPAVQTVEANESGIFSYFNEPAANDQTAHYVHNRNDEDESDDTKQKLVLNEYELNLLKSIINQTGDEDVVMSSLDDESKLNEYIDQIKRFYAKLSSNHFDNLNDFNIV